jgi:hypothetical protein
MFTGPSCTPPAPSFSAFAPYIFGFINYNDYNLILLVCYNDLIIILAVLIIIVSLLNRSFQIIQLNNSSGSIQIIKRAN